MIPELDKIIIYVRPGITDMRKQIGGLSVIIEDQLQQDPFGASLFLFCNRERKIIKAIWWDRNGFCIWQLCKDSHKFHYAKFCLMRRKSWQTGCTVLLRPCSTKTLHIIPEYVSGHVDWRGIFSLIGENLESRDDSSFHYALEADRWKQTVFGISLTSTNRNWFV